MRRPTALVPAFLLLLSALLPTQSALAQSPPSCNPTPAGDLPGSVLVFNLYASSVANPGATNSLITVMNVGTAKSLVRFLLVSRSCTVILDQLTSLQPNQAQSFAASKLAPGEQGYAIAIEVDGNGFPSGRNGLVGSVSVKSGSELGSFGAEAIAFVGAPGGAPFRLVGATIALDFDGVSYALLPSVLLLDHFLVDDTTTMSLVLDAFGGALPSSPAALGTVTINGWDEDENGFGGELRGLRCRTVVPLGGQVNSTARVAALDATAGCLRFQATQPALGSVLTPLGGHNLRNSGARAATLTLPRTVPCPRAPVPTLPARGADDICGASEGHTGSVLFFNYILGGSAGSTQFSITNEGASSAQALAFWIDMSTDGCGSVPIKVNFGIVLTQNQPLIFDLSSAGITGTAPIPNSTADRSMLVVFAVNASCEQVSYNHLQGTAFLSAATGHVAALPAVAARAVTAAEGDLVGTPGEILFDGVRYERLPSRLVVDRIGSGLDGNDTQLIVNRVGLLDLKQVCDGPDPGLLRGTLFDAVGKGKGFQAPMPVLQIVAAPQDFFPLTFDRIVPAGKGGAMELRVTDSAGQPEAILGVVLEHNPAFATDPSAFRSGHNLHIVQRAASAELLYDVCTPTAIPNNN